MSSAPPDAEGFTEESIGSAALDVAASTSVAIEEAPESEVVSVAPVAPVSGERLVAAAESAREELPPPPSAPEPPADVVSFESEAPPSMPLGTPRELSAAAAPEEAHEEPVVAQPDVTEEPPAVAVPVSQASGPEASGKKKKKKKKDKDGKKAEARASTAPPSAPPVVAQAAAVPAVSVASKLESSSSTNEKLSSSGSHDKLTKSSGQHSKLNESGRHRALVEDDESADHFFSVAPPPVADADEPLEDLAPAPIQRSPEAIERQRKARKIVGGVVAVAALVGLLGVGRMLFGGKPADAQPRGATTQTQRPTETAAPTTATETAAAVAAPAPSPEPVAAATAEPSASATESASAEASASASAEASASASASAEASATVDAGSMTPEQKKELRRKVEVLANKGDNAGAIEAAKTYLAADPTDSYIHLHLGNAYMSMGKMKEAREAFNECVRKGKGGYIHECARWGGKK